MDPPPCNAPSFIRTLPTGILEDAHFGLSQIFKISEQVLPCEGVLHGGGSSQPGSSSMQYPFIFELSQIFKISEQVLPCLSSRTPDKVQNEGVLHGLGSSFSIFPAV